MATLRRTFGFGFGTQSTHERRDSRRDAETREVVADGNLDFVVEKGGNNAVASYQEASGAPVEASSPMGYSVGPVTIIFLNLSKMVGTGVYSTPASILKNTGSIGLSLIYWVIGFLAAGSSLSIYLEYASYFPSRSGSEVVYLEQAFPRPKYFWPTTFAVQSVLLSFSSSNAIVMSQYLFRIAGATPTAWELKGTAIACYTAAFLCVLFHTRFSYALSNGIGVVKLITLFFVAITGLVVLGGHTRVRDPGANFRDAFEGTTHSGYGLVNAMVKIIFSYAGYENAFNVVNEVKNPVKSLKLNASISLSLVTILYILANVAYFAAVPKADLIKSKQVAASLFFQTVFGNGGAAKGLNFLIALSAFGNLLVVLIGQSRLIRECGRQGVLPFTNFWVSTKPFGTPFGPYTLKWALTLLMILAPPAGDAFNFVVDLAIYPAAFFNLIMAAGICAVRYRRKNLKLGRSEFRAWNVAIVFTLAINLFMLIGPWYPPATGANGGDVSFWYASYVVTGIAILLACGLYYYLWIHAIPKWRGYRIRHETIVLAGGEVTHRLTKVDLDKLEEWDRTHNAAGDKFGQGALSDDSSGVIESSLKPKSDA